jgi:hypothetical protein
MTHPSKILLVSATAFGLALIGACGDSGSSGGGGGSGPSVTVTAPGIVGPSGGTNIAESQPTLRVTNATASDGSSPTYTFQVATDSGFSSIVAQQSGVGQGSAETTWQVATALSSGPHFWRARASSGGVNGPFSSVAEFTVSAVGTGPGERLLVNDPLQGSTIATDRSGGTFTSRGWRIETNADFLRYEVPTVVNGYVQWQNVGLTPRGANEASHMLFGMWDPRAGAYRANPFRVHVQKLWNNPHNPPFLRMRWISQGRLEDAGSNFNSWDPGQVYTWRVDWGPEAGAHTARVYLDGNEMMQIRYTRPYQPNTHWIELGVQERGESVIDAVYFNFVVVTRE